jgi:sensor domain CHASE-containing protein
MTKILPARVDVEATADHVGLFTVSPVWPGVDRPNVGGTCVRGRKLADRLAAAWRDGAAYSAAEVRTDTSGQTYVHATSRILGRMANADLKRLGY